MSSAMWDLVIRDGLIVDGSGGEPHPGTIAISDGKIAWIGDDIGPGREEIDATGLIVTPGFVDIHTHYDGQITWENRTAPSCLHGVTTILTGNCGVGFAPCRPVDRGALISLMEGVEDIPEIVMATGLPWAWETFPDYLDFLEGRRFDADVATQLPHSALRVYVMGQRGVDGEDAAPEDLALMKSLACDAMQAGALGFATSRSMFHKDSAGRAIPTHTAAERELHAIAAGMKEAGHGVLEALLDFDATGAEIRLARRVSEQSGRPFSFTLIQMVAAPDRWEQALHLLEEANGDGIRLRGQVIGRPTGILMGFELSWCPFSLRPSYEALAGLPWDQKWAALRDPETRRRILSETAADPKLPLLQFLSRYDWMFLLGDPPNYEPSIEDSVANRAHREGRSNEEVAYDLMLGADGKAILFAAVANYSYGTLAPVLKMMKHPHTVLGLGDGGAHYGIICDAGYPTFMLTYWTRDRTAGEKMTLPEVVRALSHETASLVGLDDRGLIREGYKADINLIDYERLQLHGPRISYDLPAGGRRLKQAATGYVATIVSGVVTYRNGAATGALPGRLVRGPQTPAPRAIAEHGMNSIGPRESVGHNN